jgi:hypothetical protein
VLFILCIIYLPKNPKTATATQSKVVFMHANNTCPLIQSSITDNLFKLPYFMPVNQTTHRLIIYASDIRLLTGCSKSTSLRQLSRLKIKLGKETHMYVMIEEYCNIMGIDHEKTLEQLKLK